MATWIKYSIAGLVFVVLVTAGVYFMLDSRTKSEPEHIPEPVVVEEDDGVIGVSRQGRDIESFVFGDGEKKVMFVGGIHGGYEWNSVYLMHRYIDYLEENPDTIPDNVELTVIPVLNPDGLFKVIGTAGRFDPAQTPSVKETESGRFNAFEIDLNRNFDCNWQATSTWRTTEVNAGTSAFSEPESLALRDLVLKLQPESVVFWHSASDAVYASACNEEGVVAPETERIMQVYADASGYKAIDSFEHYEITGDAGDWLAKIGIPSIAVEMKTHETIDWDKELAGITALFDYYQE